MSRHLIPQLRGRISASTFQICMCSEAKLAPCS
jgi:hypothetical protein